MSLASFGPTAHLPSPRHQLEVGDDSASSPQGPAVCCISRPFQAGSRSAPGPAPSPGAGSSSGLGIWPSLPRGWAGSLRGRPGPCLRALGADIIYSKSPQVFLAPNQAWRSGLLCCPLPPPLKVRGRRILLCKIAGLGFFLQNEVLESLCPLVGQEEAPQGGRGS